MGKVRLVKKAKFRLKPHQDLVVSLGLLGTGLDRVIVEHDDSGVVRVGAYNGPGGGTFEFQSGKRQGCDFFISRAQPKVTLEETVTSMFYGQFTWTELTVLHGNRRLRRKLDSAVRALVREFEENAVQRLNSLVPFKRFKGSGDGNAA